MLKPRAAVKDAVIWDQKPAVRIPIQKNDRSRQYTTAVGENTDLSCLCGFPIGAVHAECAVRTVWGLSNLTSPRGTE